MELTSRTFVVRVRDGQGIAIEDVRSGRRAQVTEPLEIGRQISEWLARAREEADAQPGSVDGAGPERAR